MEITADPILWIAVKKPPMVESKINAGDLEELFDKKP
jgi:hypothetical protein